MRKNKRKHRLWGLVLTFGLILGLLPSGVLAESDEGHTHTDACYCKGGELICGEEESAGHTHDESCYETVTTEDGETEQTLICGEEESEGHTHTADCYCQGGELICGEDAIDGEMGVDEDIDAGFTISEEEEAAGTSSHAAETEIEVQAETQMKVNAYVSDGTIWKSIGSFTTTLFDSNEGRYYVYADALDDIFGPYGFDSTKYNGETIFPHTDSKDNGGKMWYDAPPEKDETGYKIWLTKKAGTTTYLFYTPNTTTGTSDNGSSAVIENNEALLTANKVEASYYTVRITDPDGVLKSEEQNYVKSYRVEKENPAFSVTLPVDTTLTWTVYDRMGDVVEDIASVDNGDGTATYTIANVTQLYEFRATAQEDVHCFVQVDGKWVEASQQLFATKQMTDNNKIRFYISVDELEKVYGDYGFKASAYKDDLRIFPHTTTGDKTGKIWFDSASKEADGTWWIPLSTYQRDGADINLYYVPGNVGDNSNKNSAKPADLINAANGFYSIRATNPANLPLTGKLPAVQYGKGGTAAQITLPEITDDKGEWTILKDDATIVTETVGENSDNNTVTYTITNLSGAVTFVATQEGKVMQKIAFQASAAGQIQPIGSVSAGMQTEIVQDGTIDGSSTQEKYALLGDDETYTVPAPDSDIVEVSAASAANTTRRMVYAFKGWEVQNGNGVILQPKDEITREQMMSYSKDGQVTLKAIWKGTENNGWIPTANFYVSLDCEIKDNKGDGVRKDNPAESFTSSLFATRVLGVENIPKEELTSSYVLCISEDSSTATAVDTEIHNMATTAIPMPTGARTQLKMENFPSDADVLAKIRAAVENKEKTVKVDGQVVSADKLTTDHFKVRWYVVKYLNDDGWHVDGVLVAKEAHFVVTMQLAGNKGARDTVRNGDFKITVSHDDGSDQTTQTRAAGEAATYADEKDFTLMLKKQSEINGGISSQAASGDTSEKIGYTSYDEATDTYTWSLTARPGRQYTILQNGQTINGYTCSASYVVLQPTGEDTESEILANDYANVADKGIQITAHSYATDRTDLYQKIEFVNSYTASAEIPIKPVDPNRPVNIDKPDNGNNGDNGNNNQPDKPDNGNNGDNGNNNQPDKPDNGNNNQPDTPSRPSHSHKPSKADNQPSEPDTKPDEPSEPDNQPSEPNEQPNNGNQTDNGSQTITQPDAAEDTADVSNTDTAASVDAVPQTGDSMNPVLWASLLGISLAGLGAAFVLMKKKQNR